MSALLNFLQMLSVAFPQKYKDQKVLWESILSYLLTNRIYHYMHLAFILQFI